MHKLCASQHDFGFLVWAILGASQSWRFWGVEVAVEGGRGREGDRWQKAGWEHGTCVCALLFVCERADHDLIDGWRIILAFEKLHIDVAE
jgi:hypothetical protein